MTNVTTIPVVKSFNSYTDYTKLDRNRERTVVFYGRVSTEHEAQLSALENQMQWYSDQCKFHPNWNVIDRYIDEGITGTQAKKRPSFLRMIEDAKSGKFDLIVTREVCRFARNTVDTLEFTRQLKNIGVEVFFVEDNIWTMDGDGELRLSLMATLAQEESRKVSERVKAGQKISRENGMLYGNGNILGYDRKAGETYTINPEQAETVKMIFEMYASGMGSPKIVRKLTELKRKNSSGKVKWESSAVLRILSNATYKGYLCYNKSRSNNYLEQKRICNRNEETYVYEKGDFQPIVSEELWERCYKLRKAKSKPSLVENGVVKKFSKRAVSDFWQSKLKCKCGSSFRKDIWYKTKNGDTSYGYNCYNRVRNGDSKTRAKLGLDTDGFCDMKMICDWKIDLMAQELFGKFNIDYQELAAQTLELIREYYTESLSNTGFITLDYVKSQREKLEVKRKNILNMRAENEIGKEDFSELKAQLDSELEQLKNQENNILNRQNKQSDLFSSLENIEKSLHELSQVGSELNREFIGKLIESIVPESSSRFVWNIRTDFNKKQSYHCNISGRKNKAIVKIDEFADEEGALPSLHKNSSLNDLLHRRLLLIGISPRIALQWEFPITYEMARAYQKANGKYLRQNQW